MRIRVSALGVAAVLACAAPGIMAQSPDYVSTRLGPTFPSGHEALDGSGVAIAASYGRSFGERLGGELTLTGAIHETEQRDATDFYQSSLTLDAIWALSGRRGLTRSTYLIGGVGLARNDFHPDELDSIGPLIEVGIGATSAPMFGRNIQLRAEAKYAREFTRIGHAVPKLLLGFEIPLRTVEPPPVRREIGRDAPRVEVRERTREIVRTVPRLFVDSDHDNVDDDHDRCPATAEGTPADQFGCPLPTPRRIELTGVQFDTGKAEIRVDSYAALDAVLPNLRDIDGMRIEVAGHTDTVGSAAANARLSEARANAIRLYLESKGIPAAKLSARGYGETDLLVSPEITAADRERNRRVELRLTRQ